MDVLFSVKIFDDEFSPNLNILTSPESKKVVFGKWFVSMCVCERLYGEYLALYIYKTNEDRSNKF